MELQQVLILLASSQCRAHDFEARGRREGGARSPYHSSGRHLLVQHLYTLQGPCTGARVEGSGCRLGGCKGCTWRCLARAHTHTHTFTHFASEGGTCRWLAQHPRGHSLCALAYSQWFCSERTQVLHAFFMYCHMHIYATIATILHILHMWHIVYS